MSERIKKFWADQKQTKKKNEKKPSDYEAENIFLRAKLLFIVTSSLTPMVME